MLFTANDSLRWKSYAQLMGEGVPHLTLTLDTKRPIEIGDFVSVFTSLASQYESFMRSRHPDLEAAAGAEVFVTEVRPGSIQADLLPWITNLLVPALSTVDQIMIVEQFVQIYGARIAAYFRPGGRIESASKGDLADFLGATTAIANDPDGSARLEASYFEDGTRKIKAAFKFSTSEARQAVDHIANHRKLLDAKSAADHVRVLMVFSQSNVKNAALGKKSGERVIIEAISGKERPVIYASELAEQRIKHEIRDAPDNVYKKGFVVDVNVELSQGRPVAYRVTNLHDVIDLPDD